MECLDAVESVLYLLDAIEVLCMPGAVENVRSVSEPLEMMRGMLEPLELTDAVSARCFVCWRPWTVCPRI
jgi:hypothetical protein